MGKYRPESMFASLSAAAKRLKWKESEDNDRVEYKGTAYSERPGKVMMDLCGSDTSR